MGGVQGAGGAGLDRRRALVADGAGVKAAERPGVGRVLVGADDQVAAIGGGDADQGGDVALEGIGVGAAEAALEPLAAASLGGPHAPLAA